MAKMTAEKKDFERLKNLITLEGNLNPNQSGSETLVDDFLLELDEENGKVTFSGVATSQTGYAEVEFSNVEVEEGGKIAVQNIEKFSNVLSLFDSEEELTMEDSSETLTIKGSNMDFEVKSSNPTNLKSKEDMDQISLDYNEDEDSITFLGQKLDIVSVIESSDLRQIVEVGNVVDTEAYPLEVKEGKFFSVLGDKTTGEMAVESELVESDGKTGGTNIMKGLGGLSKHLSGEVQFYMQDGGPVSFKQKTDDHEVNYYILPV